MKKTWEVKEYDGDCRHNNRAKVKQQGYGTMYCEMCGASCNGGVWRVLIDGRRS